MFGLSRIVTLVAIIAVLALILITAGPAACNKIRSLGAQSRVTQGQLGAAHDSATDAIATVGAGADRERDSEALSQSNEKEIRNAHGANQKVDPAARDAGLRSLCRRAAYRDSAKCKMRGPAAR